MWQVSLLVANADKLPDSVKTALYRPIPLPPAEPAAPPTGARPTNP